MTKRFRLAVALVALFSTACQKKEVILEDLSQREANEVVVLLRSFAIAAEKISLKERKTTTYKISVDARHTEEALKILVDNQLPKNPSLSLKEVYPPGSAGLIPTKSDERARLFMALQGEIESMLRLLPSIADARVILAMDRDQTGIREVPQKSASVAVVYYPVKESKESPLSDEEIKALVSASISDLAPDDVTVLQKPLTPTAYLGPAHPTRISSRDLDPSKNMVWATVCIIAIAVLTGAYMLARPYLKRRTARRFELATPGEI